MPTILAFLLSSFVLLLPKLTQEAIEPSPKRCEEPSERVCPTCGSEHVIKNGSVHNNKPKYQCKICGRQFVINPTNLPVSEETKQLID
jgi:transposase-like protein